MKRSHQEASGITKPLLGICLGAQLVASVLKSRIGIPQQNRKSAGGQRGAPKRAEVAFAFS